jgi:O-antigen ligase
MAILILLILAWGALAFGAVYEWAYWPLLAASAAAGVWGLVRDVPRVRHRINVPVLAGILLMATAIGMQLIPMPRATLMQMSPATDEFLRQYDVGYALRVVLVARGITAPGAPGAEAPGLHEGKDPAPNERSGLRTDAATLRHPLSIDPHKTMVGLAFLIGLGLLLLGVVRGLEGLELRIVVQGLAALGVLLSLTGIVQRALWNGKFYGFWTPENVDVTGFGPFINRNHFAGWMLMAVPLVLSYSAAQVMRGMEHVSPGWRNRAMWFSTSEARRAVLTGLSALVMALAATLTVSRSGIVCLLIAILIFGFHVLRHHGLTGRQRWLWAYTVIAFVVIAGWVGIDDVLIRFDAMDSGMAARTGAWRDAWRIHEMFPWFGVGFNTYGTATVLLQQFQVGVAHYIEAHNDYLQILVEGGYLVAVPALLLMVLVAWQIRARFREGQDDHTGYWIRLGAVTGIIAMMAQEVVDFSLQMPGNAVLFTVLCAVAIRKATPKAGARGSGLGAWDPEVRSPRPSGRGDQAQSATPDLKVRGYVLILLALGMSACGEKKADSKSVEAVYSKTTGKLELLKYDSNKDGKTDVWSYMDGTRLLRLEIDSDFNGVIDRWEYYTDAGAIEKIGFSRQKDGVVDAWAFQAPDGTIGQVQVSTRRDGTVTRWEHYEKGVLVRAEDDSDGDGRPDRWETYQDGALATLALDTMKQGRPDRRLIYGRTGVTVEKLP